MYLNFFLPEINLGQNCLNFWHFFWLFTSVNSKFVYSAPLSFSWISLKFCINLRNKLKINITNIIAIKFILGKFMVVSSGKFLFIHQYE